MRMRMIFAFLLTLCLCVSAHAQVPMTGAGKGAPGGAAGYTGPGDIVSFSGWWGLRAYSSAKRGTKAISLCDNTGASCADVLTNASTGVLNSPGTRGANNCNTSGTCLIATIYDQTVGANDCIQASAANMAQLNMTSGPGGTTPAAIFNGTSTQYPCTAGATTIPVSSSTVAERTGNTSAFGSVVSYGQQNDLGFGNSTNTGYAYSGSVLLGTAADNAWHAMQGLFNTTGAIYIDGSNTTGAVGTTAPAAAATLIGNGIGGFLSGRMSEAGTLTGDQSANFSALNSNQHAFWGF